MKSLFISLFFTSICFAGAYSFGPPEDTKVVLIPESKVTLSPYMKTIETKKLCPS